MTIVTDDEVEIASAAFSDDECVICGKPKSHHNMGSGYAMCMCYPLFVSKRDMFKRLAPLAASDRDVLVAEIERLREALEPFAKAADIKLCGVWGDGELFGRTDVGFALTFGDLRQARAALTPLGGEGLTSVAPVPAARDCATKP